MALQNLQVSAMPGLSDNTATVRITYEASAPMSAQDASDVRTAVNASLTAQRAAVVDAAKQLLKNMTRAEKDVVAAEAAK